MACRRSLTALERYAKSLQSSQQPEEILMQYPMYTVPVKEVLNMEEVRPHEALMEDDILVQFHQTMGKAAFVSHQWVSPWHPDPEFSQFKHLQGALKKILTSASGVHRVHPHLMTEIASPVGFVKGIATEEFKSKPLFVWYDYFSCPQINDMKWSLGDLAKPIDQALQSIPAYIASCSFFFVLVPPVETPSRTELLGLSTWASRGWCRMEKVLKELQPKNAYVVLSGENHWGTIEAPIMSHMIGGPAGEGTFGFREDYQKLGLILTKFLQRLILHHLKEEHFSAYRFFLNMQSVYLRGFPNLSPDLFHPVTDTENDLDILDSKALAGKEFLFQNGFEKVKEIDAAGWSPLCYAALRGDAAILRSLLELRANPNDKTLKNQSLFGVQAGVTVLGIATFFCHNQAVQALIEARANLSGGLIPPLLMAAQVNNVEAIRLLCAAGDRPDRVSLVGLTAAQLAASTSSKDALRELLLSGMLSLSGSLVAAATFAGTVEIVDQVVAARADINDQSYSSVLWFFHNLRYRCGARTGAAHVGYHSFGATPLMYAIVAGQHEVAAALIVAKAKLDLVNYRNKTALDLAHQFQAPSFLIDALLGDVTVCNRIVSSAKNRHPVESA